MSTPLLPDTIAVAREALLAQTAITSSAVGTRVHGRVPTSPVYPLLALFTVDDAELQFHTGIARVQIDVWGAGSQENDEEIARTVARTIVSVVRDLRGVYSSGRISNSGYLSTVPAPDPDTGRVRFVVDIEIEINPL